jgi:hypothetical protein
VLAEGELLPAPGRGPGQAQPAGATPVTTDPDTADTDTDTGTGTDASRPVPPATVRLHSLRRLPSLADYAATLAEPGPWVGAFDLPFGLPRELVETLGWPTGWLALMQHYRQLDRAQIRAQFAAFCNARPAGRKFAHRACDGPAGSSPSMKWVNPPVAWMLHAGVPPLIDAGCELPGLHAGDPARVALEAYPGLLAREVLGRRPYKSDTPARQDAGRRTARADLVDALQAGRTRLGLRLVLSTTQRDELVDEPQGDLLDATLCLLQAGWASLRPGWGLPGDVDPLEGWIVSAQQP